jgi:hypothetical protein
MLASLSERERAYGAVLPWEHPNFGLDPDWARCYPYEQTARLWRAPCHRAASHQLQCAALVGHGPTRAAPSVAREPTMLSDGGHRGEERGGTALRHRCPPGGSRGALHPTLLGDAGRTRAGVPDRGPGSRGSLRQSETYRQGDAARRRRRRVTSSRRWVGRHSGGCAARNEGGSLSTMIRRGPGPKATHSSAGGAPARCRRRPRLGVSGDRRSEAICDGSSCAAWRPAVVAGTAASRVGWAAGRLGPVG